MSSYSVTTSIRAVRLTGWGRVSPSRAELAEPASVAGAARLSEPGAAARGVIARGLGRSYNNAAQCEGGLVISTARLNRILDLDPATGLATCEAGVSLEQLMIAGLPNGWFVPVSPGTRQVTIGGAVAPGVPGKNPHPPRSLPPPAAGVRPPPPACRARRLTPPRRPPPLCGSPRR